MRCEIQVTGLAVHLLKDPHPPIELQSESDIRVQISPFVLKSLELHTPESIIYSWQFSKVVWRVKIHNMKFRLVGPKPSNTKRRLAEPFPSPLDNYDQTGSCKFRWIYLYRDSDQHCSSRKWLPQWNSTRIRFPDGQDRESMEQPRG